MANCTKPWGVLKLEKKFLILSNQYWLWSWYYNWGDLLTWRLKLRHSVELYSLMRLGETSWWISSLTLTRWVSSRGWVSSACVLHQIQLYKCSYFIQILFKGIQSFFWSIFSNILTEYRNLLCNLHIQSEYRKIWTKKST